LECSFLKHSQKNLGLKQLVGTFFSNPGGKLRYVKVPKLASTVHQIDTVPAHILWAYEILLAMANGLGILGLVQYGHCW
jgi:hypothetical protein